MTAEISLIPRPSRTPGSRQSSTANCSGGLKSGAFSMASDPGCNGPSYCTNYPVSQVEAMKDCAASVPHHEFQCVSPSFSTINLYSKTSKLPLSVSLVVKDFKAAKARAVSTLLSSEDGKVRHASKPIKCGRKWKPQQSVMEAECHWKHLETMGVVCQGRLDLGHYSEKRWSRADARARRDLVVQRLHESAEEEECQVKAIGLASQGRWMQWDQAQERPLSWKELWQIDQGTLSFLLRLLTDLLPTPRNIKIWGGEEGPS